MVATATIVGQTFVNIYKEYFYLGHNLNNNQNACDSSGQWQTTSKSLIPLIRNKNRRR